MTEAYGVQGMMKHVAQLDSMELESLNMGLDKLIAYYEVAAPKQKKLMDEGNSYAGGRWTEMVDIIRYIKWLRKMASE